MLKTNREKIEVFGNEEQKTNFTITENLAEKILSGQTDSIPEDTFIVDINGRADPLTYEL